jgi:hypothetical protein
VDNVLLITLIVLPPGLAYLLRSNGALGFLALCGGFTAMSLSGSDIEQLFGKTKITSLTSSNVDLALLALPLLLTLLLTHKSTLSQTHWRVLQAGCALLAGGMLAIVAAPMISDILNTSYSTSLIWKNLQKAQSYIIGLGLLLSLFLLWFNSPKQSGKKT